MSVKRNETTDRRAGVFTNASLFELSLVGEFEGAALSLLTLSL